MAVEFSKFDSATDIGTDLGSYRQGLFEGFLAGYDAGYENCLKTIGDLTEHLEKQLIEEMYVNIEPLLKEKNEVD